MPQRRDGAPPPSERSEGTVRLQAYLARAGVSSRRGGEELIREGRVTVNGRPAEIGTKVDPARDVIRLDRQILSLRATSWVALHKPRGYVTTREDPTGRRTIYDLLPAELHHLFHVGRLDRDSSGLLLLTNDGDTANRLLHPRYGTLKEYQADVEGQPDFETLEQLVEGVELEDGIAHAVNAELRGQVDDDVYRIRIVLEEGRNREVRRMLDAVGHPVIKLFRRSFGPIQIGKLPPGRWRHLTTAEIASLKPAPRAPKRSPADKPPGDRSRRPRR